MSYITLDQANAIIAGAFSYSDGAGLKPLGVAVVDAGAHLIAFQRQDGASIGRLQIALGKASGALAMGLSSRKIGELAQERPTFIGSLGSIFSGGVVPAAGGVLVVGANNRVIGAVGISGDLSDMDELAALAGIQAAGLAVQS